MQPLSKIFWLSSSLNCSSENPLSSDSGYGYEAKMASKSQPSPLFSPRPHLVGVGRAISLNIFTEFSKLSPLTIRFSQMNTRQADVKQTEMNEEQPNQGLKQNSIFDWEKKNETSQRKENRDEKIPEDKSKENQQNHTETNGKNPPRHDKTKIKKRKYPGYIVDRDQYGNERHISYSFNKMTCQVFDIFHSLNIPFETELYKPKEERQCVDPNIFYCKNLFLKDRKGQYYLVICHEDSNVDLKYLRKALKAYRNFNFVSGEEMKLILGTDPGGVTPLSLMFANSIDVSMVISRTLCKEGASLMFHPLDSNLATKISTSSLLRYLKYVGHTITFVD